MNTTPHPWNCTPPLPEKLGLKHSPLSLALCASLPPAELKARGRGLSGSTRFRVGYSGFPLSSTFHDLSVPDHQTVDAAGYAFGFPTYPSRWPDASQIQVPRANGTSISAIASDDKSVFQIVKELRAAESGRQGGSCHNEKTPMVRWHQPGFLGDPREVPDIQVTSRIIAGG